MADESDDADLERYRGTGHIQWLPHRGACPPQHRQALVGVLLCAGAILGIGALFLVAAVSLHATGSLLRIEVVRR